MDKLFFIFNNVVFLFLFLASCFGFGYQIIKNIKVLNVWQDANKSIHFVGVDRVLIICLSLSLGMGVFIVILQLLGILGYINRATTITVTVLGLLFFINGLLRPIHEFLLEVKKAGLKPFKLHNQYLNIILFGVLTLGLSIAIIRSLAPPIKWDEIMYHLPHAREWANTGYITINKWLRYPYFPYNFELLYAACLTLKNEVLTHLIHSAAGILTLIGVYRVSLLQFNRKVACLAAIILSISVGSLDLFYSAYIDLGLTLFTFFGFYCAYLGYLNKNLNCFCLGAFLIGVAVGTKYQALIYIVPFILMVLIKESKLINLLKIAFYFLLPCAYWYVRNYLLTGNPIEPLAGTIFGYYSWNQADMDFQLADLNRVANWPNLLLWPSIFSLFFIKKLSKFARVMIFISIYAFIIWCFTSHYSRYLVTAYPFMAILSAVSINLIGDALIKIMNRHEKLTLIRALMFKGKFSWIIYGLILIPTAYAMLDKLPAHYYLDEISITEGARNEFLKDRVKSYEIGLFLKKHPEYITVQRYFEGEMYYLPKDTIGDWFGEGRYNDYVNLEPKLLAKKIKAFHANTYLVAEEQDGKGIDSQTDFDKYFFLIINTKHAKLYGLRE